MSFIVRLTFGGSAMSSKFSWFFRSDNFFVWHRLLACMSIVILGTWCFFVIKGPSEFRKTYYPLYYQDEIQAASLRHTISPYLICAIIKSESDWNTSAHSRAGAKGLMQVLPSTAADMAEQGLVDSQRYPLDKLDEAEVSIEYGTAYLRYLVDRYHELEPVIAAYNAGLGNVDKWLLQQRNIRAAVAFPETEKYLYKVVRAKEAYETLYPATFMRP